MTELYEVCDKCGSVVEYVVWLDGSKECMKCYESRFDEPKTARDRYEKPVRFAGIGAEAEACAAENSPGTRSCWLECPLRESRPAHAGRPAPENLYSDMVSAALETTELVAEKNAAYGDSFARSGEVLQILYPDGVRPDQYPDFLALVRVIDKQFRIAAKKDAFGENPWSDILGYALLAVVREQRVRGAKGSRVQGSELSG